MRSNNFCLVIPDFDHQVTIAIEIALLARGKNLI